MYTRDQGKMLQSSDEDLHIYKYTTDTINFLRIDVANQNGVQWLV